MVLIFIISFKIVVLFQLPVPMLKSFLENSRVPKICTKSDDSFIIFNFVSIFLEIPFIFNSIFNFNSFSSLYENFLVSKTAKGYLKVSKKIGPNINSIYFL